MYWYLCILHNIHLPSTAQPHTVDKRTLQQILHTLPNYYSTLSSMLITHQSSDTLTSSYNKTKILRELNHVKDYKQLIMQYIQSPSGVVSGTTVRALVLGRFSQKN